MFGTMRLRPLSREELFGPFFPAVRPHAQRRFWPGLLRGSKNKANFPPLDAYTTKDGKLVVNTTVAGYTPDQVNVQILPEGIWKFPE